MTMMNRDVKADIMIMISTIGDEKKKELIEKYKWDQNPINQNRQRILIGNWFTNAVKMAKKGATGEELNRVVEHIVVLMMAPKHNLDIYKSYKDHDLYGISQKYFGEERRIMAEKREERRKELKEIILNMKDSGCTNEYIAEELMIPESTVRNMLGD